MHIAVPRDRDGSFTPQLVRKRQRRLSGLDDLVISSAKIAKLASNSGRWRSE